MISAKKPEYNLGIDSLKIVSMFMVVMLHVLGHGGILAAAPPGSLQYQLAWLMEIASFCAVNCYALISGYVAIHSRFKLSRIFVLWLQVFLFSVGITAVFALFGRVPLDPKELLYSFFPTLTARYWYFTAYFGLFFFMPFLNKMFELFDKKTILKLILTMLVLFSLIPTIMHRDLFTTAGGYSMIWLIALYIIGGYLKKYGVPQYSNWKNIVFYVLCIGFVWLSKLIIELVTPHLFGGALGGTLLVSYTSPFIVFAAIFLVIFFSRLNVKPVLLHKIIRFLAPLSFGVYIIHVHPMIWRHLLKDRFVSFAHLPPPVMAGYVLLAVLSIYLVCSLIDYLRKMLFDLIRVNKVSKWIDQKAEKILARFESEPSVK